VTGRFEVLERMSVFRVLAASDMTTGETDAKLIPLYPERKAFLAAVGARFHALYLADMFAMCVHVRKTVARYGIAAPITWRTVTTAFFFCIGLPTSALQLAGIPDNP
jgi:hypothetical protein